MSEAAWQRFWNHWAEQTRTATAVAGQGEPGDGIDTWLDGQRQWLLLSADCIDALADGLEGDGNWVDTLQRHCRDARSALLRGDDVPGRLPPDLDWLGNWLGSLAAAPVGNDLGAALRNAIGAWPALGPSARQTRDWQQVQQALIETAEALADYRRHLAACLIDALDRWSRQTLAATPGDGPPPVDSLSECWLDCLNDAYEAMLQSDAHRDALTRLNQRLVTARKIAAPLLAPVFHGLGLATREDLAGTQLRGHQWRREQDAELEALRQRLRAVEEQLHQATGASEP